MIRIFHCFENDNEIILINRFRFVIVLVEIAMSNHSKLLIQVLNYDQKSWIHTKTLSNGHGRSLNTTFLLKTHGKLVLSSLDFGMMRLDSKNLSLEPISNWIARDILEQSKYLSIIHVP